MTSAEAKRINIEHAATPESYDFCRIENWQSCNRLSIDSIRKIREALDLIECAIEYDQRVLDGQLHDDAETTLESDREASVLESALRNAKRNLWDVGGSLGLT